MVSLIRYALFREADVDGSGEVTFDEFQIVVRKKLNLAPAEMPEARLRALCCALDADNSNAIRVDELAKLLKRYAPPQNSKPKFGGKGSVRGQAFDAFQAPLQARGTALASPSTAAMRAELEAAQVELPEVAALLQLSKLFGGRLEEFRHRIGSSRGRDTHATSKANSWYQLFARVDVDGSTAARLEARPLARAAPLISHEFELSPNVDTTLTPLSPLQAASSRSRSCRTPHAPSCASARPSLARVSSRRSGAFSTRTIRMRCRCLLLRVADRLIASRGSLIA